MENRLVSIIVPVYNVEKYLEECLDAILNQTYRKLQIILVDDGSPDRSGKICDEYAEKDSRVIVIHKNNEGVSSARNDGLAHADGDYIGFVDADDIIAPEMYEELVKAMEQENVDFCMCGYNDYVNGQLIPHEEPLPSGRCVQDEIRDKLLLPMIGTPLSRPACAAIMGSNCRVLYRNHIIKQNGIRFKKIKIAEDLLFHVEYMCKCTSAWVIPQCFYHYRLNTESATKSYKTHLYEELSEQHKLLKEVLMENSVYDPQIQEYLGGAWLYFMTWCIQNEAMDSNRKRSSKDKVLAMKRVRKDSEYQALLTAKNIVRISWKEQILFWMIKFGFYSLIVRYLATYSKMTRK